MMDLLINIKPMGAVRMTRRSKFVDERAKRYIDYVTILRSKAKQCMKENNLYILNDIPVKLTIEFHFLPPKSYSKAKLQKILNGQLMYTKKPDVDNLVKGVMDALNGTLYHDDNQVVMVSALKKYSTFNGIRIKAEPLF